MNPGTLPLVSIITVTYNSAAYVRDTIESVLAQEYPNLQYIIADDCSQDATWSIIQQFRDPRITAFRNEKNLGEYANRNKALTLATGEYVQFIDGDDIIYPHGTAFFVKMMEAFPAAALAVQKDYLNNILYPAILYPEETVANYFMGKENLLSSSFASDFYRTHFLKAAGGIATKFVGGDNELRLRIAAQYQVLLVAGWVSWPRETPGQASSKISEELHLKENNAFIAELEATCDLSQVGSSTWSAIKLYNKRIIARYVLRQVSKGNLQKANSLLKATGTSWWEVKKYWNFSPNYIDVLDRYSPTQPLKRGYLKP